MTSKLKLVAGWDAALTYDALRKRSEDGTSDRQRRDGDPVFVGREELLGSLVDAISEPDRRGTYLVSGYRGAGKTTLVIEAARQAIPLLHKKKRRLLPLVLNVSEVSASLTAATDREMPPLGIDARKLLTALLRALRNELEDEPAAQPHGALKRILGRTKPVAGTLVKARELVVDAYDKAEASQYARHSQQSAASAASDSRSVTRSLQVANVMKLVSVVAALAAVAVGGFALLDATVSALGAVCAALAGVAVMSFGSSRAIRRETSQSSLQKTELTFDNSLHQIESDLKKILAELDKAKMRTMFVLEELDKVDDEKGEQLDAVIRYFKNLFTQAPALFFFLTDKGYFDLVETRLATARAARSYAVEHTFFTNRVFVSRPGMEACLDYLLVVIDDDAGRAAVEQIRGSRDARSRSIGEMSDVERFLRVLLFSSQNHLFDLKNEMRGFVVVSDDGSHLGFDDSSFPPRQQGLAALHFLLEQKLKLYWFGGGREYANEILRNSLASAFLDIGGDAVQRVIADDAAGAGDLSRDDRRVIIEAMTSLTDDLERGGAIERTTGEPSDAVQFTWRDNAVSSFSPTPELEPHEQALHEQLLRAIRVTEQLGPNGPLGEGFVSVDDVERLTTGHRSTINAISSASRPLTREEASQRSGEIVRDLAPIIADGRGAHMQRLQDARYKLEPSGGTSSQGRNVLVVRDSATSGDGRLIVVHGPEELQPESARRLRESLGPGPLAAVLVDDDPDAPEDVTRALTTQWRAALAGGSAAPVLVCVLPLGEGIVANAGAGAWGTRLVDEIVFAGMWLEQLGSGAQSPAPRTPAWLGMGVLGEERFPSVADALTEWLAQPSVLGAPPDAGNDAGELVRAVAQIASTSERAPVLLLPDELPIKKAPSSASAAASERVAAIARLLKRGRLIALYRRPRADARPPAVIALPRAPHDLSGGPLWTLRQSDAPQALRAMAEFLEPHDAGQAEAVYAAAADRGDPEALVHVVVSVPDRPSQDLVDRLLATRDWAAIGRAGREVADSEVARILLVAAAQNKHAPSMAELLIRSPMYGGVEGTGWNEALIASGDGSELFRAASELTEADPQQALALMIEAANFAREEAMAEVVIRSPANADAAQTNLNRLGKLRRWDLLEAAARGIEAHDPERAATIRAVVEVRRDGEHGQPPAEGDAPDPAA